MTWISSNHIIINATVLETSRVVIIQLNDVPRQDYGATRFFYNIVPRTDHRTACVIYKYMMCKFCFNIREWMREWARGKK